MKEKPNSKKKSESMGVNKVMDPSINMNKITAAFTSPFPLDFENLRESLEKLGYAAPTDGMIRARLSESGQAIHLRRLVKEKIDIIYDEQKGFLALESDSEIELLLKEIKTVFECALALPSIASGLRWYEVNFTCRTLGNPHPLSVKEPKSKASDLFAEATGLDSRTFSHSLCAFPDERPDTPLNQIDNWAHITVGVFVPNPRYYQMSFVYRRQNLEDIVKFYTFIPQLIEKYSDYNIWRE